jgi:hypothetical protein
MNVEEMKHTLHELIVKGAVGYENEFDKENFADIKDPFIHYEISERGIIRIRYTGRIVKQTMNEYGVRCVSLYNYDDRVTKIYPVWHFERSPFG